MNEIFILHTVKHLCNERDMRYVHQKQYHNAMSGTEATPPLASMTTFSLAQNIRKRSYWLCGRPEYIRTPRPHQSLASHAIIRSVKSPPDKEPNFNCPNSQLRPTSTSGIICHVSSGVTEFQIYEPARTPPSLSVLYRHFLL
jgi:hypothetical protein